MYLLLMMKSKIEKQKVEHESFFFGSISEASLMHAQCHKSCLQNLSSQFMQITKDSKTIFFCISNLHFWSCIFLSLSLSLQPELEKDTRAVSLSGCPAITAHYLNLKKIDLNNIIKFFSSFIISRRSVSNFPSVNIYLLGIQTVWQLRSVVQIEYLQLSCILNAVCYWLSAAGSVK